MNAPDNSPQTPDGAQPEDPQESIAPSTSSTQDELLNLDYAEMGQLRMAARGGAVSALVLGVWAVFGALFTASSIINGALGIFLGYWGLRSDRRRLALIGIALSMLGVGLCLIQANQRARRVLFPGSPPVSEMLDDPLESSY